MVQVATVRPPVGQFVIHTLLQIAGFAVAIAFGIYAVRSVHVAVAANSFSREANSFSREAIRQALAANQLALFGACLQAGNQTENQDLNEICSRIIRGAAELLPATASSLFPNLPPPSPTTDSPDSSPTQPQPGISPPSDSGSSAPAGTIAGTIAGAVIGAILLVVAVPITCIYIRRRRRRRRRHADSPVAPTSGPGRRERRAARNLGSIFREVFMNSTLTSWTSSVEEVTTRDEERGRGSDREREK
ncbi:hypothetical protein A1O7_03597 [Cladophialophora yegresii CBS 114405]|uniref:Uncharacterized protein n=1 Tax=Cladophialophora yegresii CBS 114405 TaxID=1182544 RepID=W9W505_9EURO|nr:uncharacterized protein A1O7_03597 [Cladophialophora yegresii CBS 114405]EXJ63152.1 hypothetical protein A1O7_03597 [Cladophialophora yegresii CBS 114405]